MSMQLNKRVLLLHFGPIWSEYEPYNLWSGLDAPITFLSQCILPVFKPALCIIFLN